MRGVFLGNVASVAVKTPAWPLKTLHVLAASRCGKRAMPEAREASIAWRRRGSQDAVEPSVRVRFD